MSIQLLLLNVHREVKPTCGYSHSYSLLCYCIDFCEINLISEFSKRSEQRTDVEIRCLNRHTHTPSHPSFIPSATQSPTQAHVGTFFAPRTPSISRLTAGSPLFSIPDKMSDPRDLQSLVLCLETGLRLFVLQ